MADEEGAAPVEVGKKPRKSRTLVPADVVEATVALLKDTLSELLAPEAVNRALDKAQKSPQWKALKAKIKAKAPKAKNESGHTGAVRSGYQAFATLCMHFNSCAMADVGLFWRSMPADLKDRFSRHMEALKAEVAARLEAGEQFTLVEALAALEARNQWRPLPWAALLQLREGGDGLDNFDMGPELLMGAGGVQVADDDFDDEDDDEDSSSDDDTTSGSESLSSEEDIKPAPPAKPVAPAAKVAAPFKPPAPKPAPAPVQPKAVAPGSPDKRKGAEGGAPVAKKHKKEKAPPALEEKKHKKHKKDKERS